MLPQQIKTKVVTFVHSPPVISMGCDDMITIPYTQEEWNIFSLISNRKIICVVVVVFTDNS